MIRDFIGAFGFFLMVQMAITDAFIGTSILAYVFSVLIVVLAVAGFAIKAGENAGSSVIFLPVAVFLLSVMFSSGYIIAYMHIGPDLEPGTAQITGLSLLFGEMGTVLSAIFLLGKAYTVKLQEAGYVNTEIESSLDGYSANLLGTGMVSIGVTLLLLILAGAVPFLNIGLLPAILLFGLFYVIIFRLVIAERKSHGK